jgi:hypothetical protein
MIVFVPDWDYFFSSNTIANWREMAATPRKTVSIYLEFAEPVILLSGTRVIWACNWKSRVELIAGCSATRALFLRGYGFVFTLGSTAHEGKVLEVATDVRANHRQKSRSRAKSSIGR